MRQRLILVGLPAAAFVIAIAVLAARAGISGGGDHVQLPAATVPAGFVSLDPQHRADLPLSAFERAQTVRILDGDTLDASVEGARVRVRLFGVDAPERGERCAQEARLRLAGLLPVGAPLLLLPGPRNDDGSRLLRYAFTAPERTSVEAVLIGEGLARAWRRDGQLRDQLVALEGRTRAAGVGCLWSRGS